MPGRARSPSRSRGKPPSRGDHLRAGVQVAGAGVVAKPGPGGQHGFQRRRGQRVHRREAAYEAFIVGYDRRDRGLLQHDLAEPDAVRDRRLAGLRAPRQAAPMAVIPAQQRPGRSDGGRGKGHEGHAAGYGNRRTLRLRPAAGLGARARVTRPAFRRRSPAAAQIMADWEIIVGPALAAMTVPRRVVRGTLTIACAGPIAIELQHMAAELIGPDQHPSRHATVSACGSSRPSPSRSHPASRRHPTGGRAKPLKPRCLRARRANCVCPGRARPGRAG